MRIAIIGRTRMLLDAAKSLVDAGHSIPLVVTQPAKDEYEATADDFQSFAEHIGAFFVKNGRINLPDIRDQLKASDCAIAFTINWPVIIEEETLVIPQHGFFNIHPGDLPRYRGNACPNWAILNNEDHIGLCVHKVVPELDAGPVLLRERMALSSDTYVGDVYDWWTKRTPEMVCEAVRLIQTGEGILEEQSSDPNTWLRSYPRRPEDSRIDWFQAAEVVHRMVRASSRPFSGAYTQLEDEARVTIWRAEVQKHKGDFLAIPGQVLAVEGAHPVIACGGEDTLRLTEVSVEGCETDEESKARIGTSLRHRLTQPTRTPLGPI